MQYFLIPIFNVDILIKIYDATELYKFQYLKKIVETEIITVESICKWCIVQGIKVETRYKYYVYDEKSIYRNIKHYIDYIIMKENLKKFKKLY